MGFVSRRHSKKKTHLTPLVDGKPCCFLIALIDKHIHKIVLSKVILSLGPLLACLAILAPIASGRQCSRQCVNDLANLVFDSSYPRGPYEQSYSSQNTEHASPSAAGAIASAKQGSLGPETEPPATPIDEADSKGASSKKPRTSKPTDFNRDIYYKNKLEFSLDGGWDPVNIPLPFDFFSGDAYNTYPLKYTLVPIIASLRWHMDDIGGPWFLRGNFDFQFSGSVTAIPRGPESRYLIYIMGMRRNFVPRNSRVAPYFDIRLGVGNIDAKGPIGVYYAQGQPLTYTFNFGSGVRYNFNSRYAISAGVNYMHISNANLSQGGGYTNYGINVLGPMVGIDVQLRRHRHHSE